MNQPLTLDQAADAARRGENGRLWSALGERSYLSLDLDGGDPSAGKDARLRRWLKGLPCPVLGIGTAAAGRVAEGCDAIVADTGAAAPLIRNIEAAPIAAAVFVQLLRATEGAPVPRSLFAESLAYATLQSGPEYRRWLEAHRAKPGSARTEDGPAVLMRREDERLFVELNRPASRNAISVEMRDALVEAFEFAAADESIQEVCVSGRGRCFSVGGDLEEFGTVPDPATGHMVRSLSLPARSLLPVLDRTRFRVHGACIGAGIELPAFAPRITAAADTHFQLPELKFGLIPGAGGCVSIPRRIGRQRTAWLVLSGKRIDAQRALEWGLIDGIEP